MLPPQMPGRPRFLTSATIAPSLTERYLMLVGLNIRHSVMTAEEIDAVPTIDLPVPENITDAERAQLLAYDAYEERCDSIRKVEQLAEKALKLDERCMDAHLAQWLMLEPDCLEALRHAMLAYEIALEEANRRWPDGPDDDIWLELENRPIIRALAAISLTDWRIDDKEGAITNAERVIYLNPDDNLGMRWHLSLWYVIEGNTEAARKLLRRYPADDVAPATYTRALVEFATKGPSRKARQYLAEAQGSNPMLFQMLQGRESSEDRPSFDSYPHGSWQEALDWHGLVLQAWETVPRAFEWVDGVRDDDDFVRRSENGLLDMLDDLGVDDDPSIHEFMKSLREKGMSPPEDE